MRALPLPWVGSALVLQDLEVLVLDCQATSVHPARGHLLEVAWTVHSASRGSARGVTSRLVRLPEGETIPSRARRATGLCDDDLARGTAPEEVFHELTEAARTVSAASEAGVSLTVVHFSAFEERYLKALRYRSAPDASFPFHFLCTHRLAKRLLPDLPRLSLRAVAGYFGEGVPELRRARDHVEATAAVWNRFLSLLATDHEVRTLDALADWLLSARAGAGARPSSRSYPMPPEALRRLPRKPGVYRMLRGNGDVLYVGKATSLRDRVRSYFRASADQHHADHTLEMLSQARDLEVVVTGSALEAALVEAEEIQRLAPPYNKALRLRERTVFFADPSLRSLSETWGPAHRIGPLRQESLFRAFVALADRIEGRTTCAAEPTDAVFGCDEVTLTRAVELLRARLGGSSLLAFGAREWRRQRFDTEEEDGEFRLEAQRSRFVQTSYRGEDVVEHLLEIVVRASHLVRRGHWIRLVSESTLVWRGKDGTLLALEIDHGSISRRLSLEGPPPPRAFVPARERAMGLDDATYDRLTVLTREIRRLIAETRVVALHVSPTDRLDAGRLARVLGWI